MSEPKPLRRSRTDSMVAGVLAGLAKHFGFDVTVLRVVYALATLFTGIFPCGVAYLVMWVIIPQEDA
ncbi:MAG: PspC domain-containing protein [Pseudomonadota bacterium]